jgi:hypothetical protein
MLENHESAADLEKKKKNWFTFYLLVVAGKRVWELEGVIDHCCIRLFGSGSDGKNQVHSAICIFLPFMIWIIKKPKEIK